MTYVTERLLGGTLTNFITIKKSIKRLKNLEKKATDGTYDKLSKKEILSIEREKEKLNKVLGGIRDMNHIPSAVFIVDAKKESIALREAKKLNLPVFALLDTNSDPDLIDYPVPCNDDAFKAINLVTHTFVDAIIEVKAGVAENEAIEESKLSDEAEPVEAFSPDKDEVVNKE